MFFNKFDVTIQFDTERHGEKAEPLKLHLPKATAEDLTLIQNFNELWQRGVQANPKENGDKINASMMLHRGWFEEDAPQEPEPVVAEPAPKAEKAPARRRKKAAEAPASKPEEVSETVAVASETQSAKEPEAATEQEEGSSEPDHPSEPEEQAVNSEEPAEKAPVEEPQAAEPQGEPETEPAEEPVDDVTAEEEPAVEEEAEAEAEEMPEEPIEQKSINPVIEYGWEQLKQTDITKEAVWKFACDSIPTDDNVTAKGERRLLSAASSMVILDPRLKNDAEATLDRVRRILRMDLEELYDLFAPENVSDEQQDAVDAFESFKTLAYEMQLKCREALAARLGA